MVVALAGCSSSPEEKSVPVPVSPTVGTNDGTWKLESGGRVVTYGDDEAWVEIHASDVGWKDNRAPFFEAVVSYGSGQTMTCKAAKAGIWS